MPSKVWLFGLVLVVPIVAFGVAEGIQARFNTELRGTIREHYSDVNPEILTRLTVDDLCTDSEMAAEEVCQTNANLKLMSWAAIWSAMIGLLLLFAIYLGGIVARNSRRLLLLLFEPGLYVTASILIMMIIVYATLAMAAIYYGESALFGRIHGKIILLIGLGALIGVYALARSAFSIIKKAEVSVLGTCLARAEAPQLWGKVEELADRLGALRPQNLVVGLDPNFYVTEADTVCLSGRLSGRTLYCSLPLCRILSKDELSSIIGHELGHFKGLDTQYSERFYPIYRGTVSSITALQEVGGEGAGQLALLPAVAVLSYFLDCFSVAESRISRTRELAADVVGANATSPQLFASALVKIHAFSGAWLYLQQVASERLKKGEVFVNTSTLYAKVVVNSDGREALRGILTTHTPHPTDSHPALGSRLEFLNVSIEEVSPAALDVSPADPAIGFLESPEDLEEKLSSAHQMMLAKRLGLSLDGVDELREAEPLAARVPTCPNCGTEYRAADYRVDVAEWRCSGCGNSLPKKE